METIGCETTETPVRPDVQRRLLRPPDDASLLPLVPVRVHRRAARVDPLRRRHADLVLRRPRRGDVHRGGTGARGTDHVARHPARTIPGSQVRGVDRRALLLHLPVEHPGHHRSSGESEDRPPRPRGSPARRTTPGVVLPDRTARPEPQEALRGAAQRSGRAPDQSE